MLAQLQYEGSYGEGIPLGARLAAASQSSKVWSCSWPLRLAGERRTPL